MKEYIEKLIDEKQFLTFNKNEVFIRGQKLEKGQRTELKESAVAFMKSPIWRILVQEVRKESVLGLYKATKYEDIVAGQMMIFNVEIMEKLLVKLSTL